MKIDYNQRKFRIVKTSGLGELDQSQVFVYRQVGEILSCSYNGTQVRSGHLLGTVNSQDGSLIFSYHQINHQGELSSGICKSKPEMMDSGKIRLHEQWEWLSGKRGKGESILEEV